MKLMADGKSWEEVSRKAYWDRSVQLEKWREEISAGHRSYLPGAVSGMSVSEFVHFFGKERFIADWPRLRALLPGKIASKAGVYDLAWSKLAGGGWNLRPTPDFNAMAARRRQFLVAVARTPGKSIYEVAKSLGMQYRRAHEHAVNLIRDGKLRGSEVVENGHRKIKLYPYYKQQAA
ncbi:MAG: hypothetical protein HZB40_15040 [Rhodocyclales bacterium]|nr:hypothetical protein [Rhodocyclales bacterium]